MTRQFSARSYRYWLLPLVCWAAVEGCSSNADHPDSVAPAVAGGGATGGNGAHAQAGRASAAGGELDAAGSAGVSEGGDAGAVAFGGGSGAAGADAESGAAGGSIPAGGGPSAGGTGGGPAPVCGKTQAWIDGPALSISTPDADRLGSITADELTIAWTTNPSGVVTIQYADRAAADAAFDAAKSFVGAFALDRAALSPDGLRLVLVNADRRGFTEYTRASREDTFGDPSVGPFAAFEYYAQNGMAAANSFADPLLDSDDKGFIYSEYGGDMVDTVQRTRRLFSGDPWSLGAPLVAAELEASGQQTRRPTGISADGRTLFFWDEVLGKERAGFFAFSSDSFESFLELGQLADAQPNADCTRLYHSGPGVSSLDLFVAAAQ